VVIRQVLLYLVQVVKRIEHVVLENSVELVLERGQEGSRIERVNALLVERLVPVKLSKVPELECVKHEVHSGDNLSLIHAVSSLSKVLLGQHVVACVTLIPNLGSFKSTKYKLAISFNAYL